MDWLTLWHLLTILFLKMMYQFKTTGSISITSTTTRSSNRQRNTSSMRRLKRDSFKKLKSRGSKMITSHGMVLVWQLSKDWDITVNLRKVMILSLKLQKNKVKKMKSLVVKMFKAKWVVFITHSTEANSARSKWWEKFKTGYKEKLIRIFNWLEREMILKSKWTTALITQATMAHTMKSQIKRSNVSKSWRNSTLTS